MLFSRRDYWVSNIRNKMGKKMGGGGAKLCWEKGLS